MNVHAVDFSLDSPLVNKIDVINLIGALADVEKTRNELVYRGVIASAVRVLKDPTTALDVQGSLLEVLAKLAIEKTETQFAIEQQALGTVFDLLSSAKSTDVQCQLLVSSFFFFFFFFFFGVCLLITNN